jgi:hypothetical protein
LRRLDLRDYVLTFRRHKPDPQPRVCRFHPSSEPLMRLLELAGKADNDKFLPFLGANGGSQGEGYSSTSE